MRKNTKHERWQLLISAWLDGELSPYQEAELRRHLATCAGCSFAERRLRAVRNVVRARRELSALPEGFGARLAERLEGLAAPLPYQRFSPAKLAFATAGALLVCVALGYGVRRVATAQPEVPVPLVEQCHFMNHTPQVTTQATLRAAAEELSATLNFDVLPLKPAEAGLRFTGYSVCKIGGLRAAALVFAGEQGALVTIHQFHSPGRPFKAVNALEEVRGRFGVRMEQRRRPDGWLLIVEMASGMDHIPRLEQVAATR